MVKEERGRCPYCWGRRMEYGPGCPRYPLPAANNWERRMTSDRPQVKLDMPKESKRRVKERLRPYVKVNFFLSFSKC